MNVLLIDDDRLVCVSLKTILEAGGTIRVVGIGHSAAEAVELYERLLPDILLMDIRMGQETGLSAGEKILLRHPDAKILYLTTFSDDEYIIKALRIGAKGYLLKQDFESILPALQAVERGQSVFGDAVVNKLPELLSPKKRHLESHGLSERECDIVKCVARGLSNKEIAEELYLSEGTVRNYLSAILEKLSLRDRTQLAVFYYNCQ
jgi:DNA-binding NarL/FixJ family response regulator